MASRPQAGLSAPPPLMERTSSMNAKAALAAAAAAAGAAAPPAEGAAAGGSGVAGAEGAAGSGSGASSSSGSMEWAPVGAPAQVRKRRLDGGCLLSVVCGGVCCCARKGHLYFSTDCLRPAGSKACGKCGLLVFVLRAFGRSCVLLSVPFCPPLCHTVSSMMCTMRAAGSGKNDVLGEMLECVC